MAKHRTGHLFKRGANFYCRWTVSGKVFSKALRDDQGNPITAKREAEEAQLKLMAAFVVADEATALESIVAKLDERNQAPPQAGHTNVLGQLLGGHHRPLSPTRLSGGDRRFIGKRTGIRVARFHTGRVFCSQRVCLARTR